MTDEQQNIQWIWMLELLNITIDIHCNSWLPIEMKCLLQYMLTNSPIQDYT